MGLGAWSAARRLAEHEQSGLSTWAQGKQKCPHWRTFMEKSVTPLENTVKFRRMAFISSLVWGFSNIHSVRAGNLALVICTPFVRPRSVKLSLTEVGSVVAG